MSGRSASVDPSLVIEQECCRHIRKDRAYLDDFAAENDSRIQFRKARPTPSEVGEEAKTPQRHDMAILTLMAAGKRDGVVGIRALHRQRCIVTEGENLRMPLSRPKQ